MKKLIYTVLALVLLSYGTQAQLLGAKKATAELIA